MSRMLFGVATAVGIGGLALLATCIDRVEASAPQPLAKGDRLDIRQLGSQCSERPWPYYEARCLKDARQPAGRAGDARLVLFDRKS